MREDFTAILDEIQNSRSRLAVEIVFCTESRKSNATYNFPYAKFSVFNQDFLQVIEGCNTHMIPFSRVLEIIYRKLD